MASLRVNLILLASLSPALGMANDSATSLADMELEKTQQPDGSRSKFVPSTRELLDVGVRRTTSNPSPGRVYKDQIVPHWYANNQRFWYRNNLANQTHEFIVVDVETGVRRRAFNHDRVAEQLGNAVGSEIPGSRLPFRHLEIDSENHTVTFRAFDSSWAWDTTRDGLRQLASNSTETDRDHNPILIRNVPRASFTTGRETEVSFVNLMEQQVDLYWLDTEGRRRSYGKVPAAGSRSQHTFAGHIWLVVDATGDTLAAFRADKNPCQALVTGDPRDAPRRREHRNGRRELHRSTTCASPDGLWEAFIDDHNVYVRRRDDDSSSSETGRQQAFQLSNDGVQGNAYRHVHWAPNSELLVAFRVRPGDRHAVHFVESSPHGGGRANLHSRSYPLPGDAMATYEANVFSVGDWTQTTPSVEPIDFGRPEIRWHSDGDRFYYAKVDRGHQRFRLVEIATATGESRNVLDEQTDTFIWTAHSERLGLQPITWLEKTDELIYASEVDGWRHLYLIDLDQDSASNEATTSQVESGGRRLYAPGLTNQITKGEFVVRAIDRIDEENRQVWFQASGFYSDQDPYFVHYFRVGLDGTGLTALTEGNGTHAIEYSPDGRHYIDTYSRVDLPPVHELRRTADGSLVCEIEKADASELVESGFELPEVFCSKGRDGTTDIWGIIHRPLDLDPSKSYPVVEYIYAGPHGSHVPKTFTTRNPYAALTDSGFIVVQVDGMGTANRSKSFHDICWKNLKDAGFPDRIAWMKAASNRYPYMDLDRVGIYGNSAGGQNAAAAVLFQPDFYKAAVASCGCHDNRMDKASWNEQWMGYPVGPQYSESSNIDNAHLLKGRLFLIVGEMDTNVPPESTLRLADALIKSEKDFDLLVIPGGGHGMGGRYGERRMMDFFVEHLHEVSPPDRNKQPDDSTKEPEVPKRG